MLYSYQSLNRKMLPQTRLFLSVLSRGYVQNFSYSIRIGEKPLGSIFFHPKVQFLMKKLTTVDYDKLFEVRKLGVPQKHAKYTFMTDKELEKEREKMEVKAAQLLQMPPLIDVTEDNIEILSNDSSLDGHDEHHAKIVFTDISFDLQPHDRITVVREPNGLLRTASKNERYRMNQIYSPIKGRELEMPKMFDPEYLQDVLARGDYEFVLNRACIQFNPDDEDYHRVLAATFEYVNNKGEFDKLIKTRHFGPFALYLAVNNKIDNMLRFFLEREEIMEASFLINIHRIVHAISPWSLDAATDEDEKFGELLSFDQACETVKDFISDPSNRMLELEPRFKDLVQKLKDEQELKIGTLKAHGL